MSLVNSFEIALQRLGGLCFDDLDEAGKEFLEELKQADKDLNWLECLESAGVDNWSGIDFAHELRNGEEDEE